MATNKAPVRTTTSNAITLDLIDFKTDKVEKTLVINHVHWGLIKDFLKTEKEIQKDNQSGEAVEMIEGLILKIFKDKMTPKDLEKCSIAGIMKAFKDLGKQLSSS